jgi:hypothetical protein
VVPPHDHFLLLDGYYLLHLGARHPGCCLARRDAVHPRSAPERCRFHVRLVAEVVPAQEVQRELSVSEAALPVLRSALLEAGLQPPVGA